MEENKKPDHLTRELFREGMKLLAGTVTIVATDGKAGKGGFTATAVCSVSDSPPTLLVCVNRENEFVALLDENQAFSVNILSQSMEDLANRFAGFEAVSMTDRFLEGQWKEKAGQQLFLEGCIASFGCRLDRTVESGTHTVVFGEILQIAYQDGLQPLLYFDRSYAQLQKKS